MKAQLPKQVENPYQYINSNKWALQQKIDGWRMLLSCGNKVEAFNRNGDKLECPQNIIDYFADFTTHWVFDGELLNDTYYIFDLLEIPTGNVQQWPLSKRYEMLSMLSKKFDGPIELVPLIIDDKQKKFETFKSSNAEGVVFKLLEAPYVNKVTTNILKFKFISQVDCVILDKGINDKENFLLGLYDGSSFKEVGKCSSLTGDGPKANIGDVVQVDILYVTKGDRLYQPVKPKLRFDKSPQECLVDQLELYRANKEVKI